MCYIRHYKQILKLISFCTATDPGSSFSFASLLVDNSLLHAASQDFDQALLQFIHIVHRCCSGIHYTRYCTNLKCFSCIVWCTIALFWLKIMSLTLQTFAAVRAFLCVPLYLFVLIRRSFH